MSSAYYSSLYTPFFLVNNLVTNLVYDTDRLEDCFVINVLVFLYFLITCWYNLILRYR